MYLDLEENIILPFPCCPYWSHTTFYTLVEVSNFRDKSGIFRQNNQKLTSFFRKALLSRFSSCFLRALIILASRFPELCCFLVVAKSDWEIPSVSSIRPLISPFSSSSSDPEKFSKFHLIFLYFTEISLKYLIADHWSFHCHRQASFWVVFWYFRQCQSPNWSAGAFQSENLTILAWKV